MLRGAAKDDAITFGEGESDIYGLFGTAQDVGTQFLFRTCVDRQIRRILEQPPLYKRRRCCALERTILHATERGKPRGRDRIDRKPIINSSVTSRARTIEELQSYALRYRNRATHTAITFRLSDRDLP